MELEITNILNEYVKEKGISKIILESFDNYEYKKKFNKVIKNINNSVNVYSEVRNYGDYVKSEYYFIFVENKQFFYYYKTNLREFINNLML